MEKMVNSYIKAMQGEAARDYLAAREQLKRDGVTAATVVLAADFVDAVQLAYNLTNPADFGRDGKNAEVMERVLRWLENGRSWAHWGEFHARKHGYADVGRRTEMKTGCGDWLYSRTYADRSRIIAEYWKKETLIRWATDEFTIECTWHELFDYLASYNDKGIETWFKTNTKYNVMISETVVMMQEYKTSKRKIKFLQACPYNE